jgi:Ni2+-binding GTPase involved in maturation of urease and hydrogenase
MTERPQLVVVGGFLGAGKTTLILAAARILAQRGVRSAVILNDQGDDLVDTKLARAAGVSADQVAGGCFCCRFSDLISAASRLREFAPDVIFAEPVGSCTDISATILQPLRAEFAGDYRLAPYTVLVDPHREETDADMRFLFEKQLEEADLICFTKSDLAGREGSEMSVSARTGEGVEAWLDMVLSTAISPGSRILEIDYQRYAEAEAALAWLNASIHVHLETPLSPAMVLGPLVDGIHERLHVLGVSIAHLKVFNDTPTGFLKAAIARNGDEPSVEGALDASPAQEHILSVNLRAIGDPAAVENIMREEIAKLPGFIEIDRMVCFRPSPPKPERRMTTFA